MLNLKINVCYNSIFGQSQEKTVDCYLSHGLTNLIFYLEIFKAFRKDENALFVKIVIQIMDYITK